MHTASLPGRLTDIASLLSHMLCRFWRTRGDVSLSMILRGEQGDWPGVERHPHLQSKECRSKLSGSFRHLPRGWSLEAETPVIILDISACLHKSQVFPPTTAVPQGMGRLAGPVVDSLRQCLPMSCWMTLQPEWLFVTCYYLAVNSLTPTLGLFILGHGVVVGLQPQGEVWVAWRHWLSRLFYTWRQMTPEGLTTDWRETEPFPGLLYLSNIAPPPSSFVMSPTQPTLYSGPLLQVDSHDAVLRFNLIEKQWK